MTTQNLSASGRVWDAIEGEKRRDRLLRRVSITAWSVTLVLVVALAVMVGIQVVELAKGAMVGAVPWMSVVGVAMPLVITLGMLSVLVGTVSTIGVFLRMRTASLTEVQLRLAALEDMLVTRGQPSDDVSR
jgi:flagellar biosynthesis protein FliR